MVRILLALLALVALMWFFSRIGRLPPERRAPFLRRAALYGGVAAVLLLVFSGRAPAIFALVAGVIPWLQRAALARRVVHGLRGMGIQIPGLDALFGGPGVTQGLRFLNISRDSASGRLTGAVVEGRFSGQRLDDMNLVDLMNLLAEIGQSKPAAPDDVSQLEAYLDQSFEDWRDQFNSKHAASLNAQQMSQAEALEVLGLEPGATREEIIDAHRKLISKVHPDRGGVTWLAVKINQAKDVLLG